MSRKSGALASVAAVPATSRRQSDSPVESTVSTGTPKPASNPNPPATPGDAPRVVRGSWRRCRTGQFAMICFMITLTTFAVHRYALIQDQSTLPIPELISELEEFCPQEMQEDFARNPPRLPSGRIMGEDESGRLPPPSAYGVAVWADDDVLHPYVTDTVVAVDQRLQEGDHNRRVPAEGPLQTPKCESQYLHLTLRVQRRLRAAFLAANKAPMMSESEALQRVGALAAEQQLGLVSLRHAFAPHVHRETHMVSISLISLPASLFPFIADPGAKPAQCHSFDVRQSFCVLLTYDNGSYYASDRLQEEVKGAVASVLAYDMRIEGFAPDMITRWHRVREKKGCIYAVQSLRMLLDSINGNPDMTIPFAVHSVFARLAKLVAERRLVPAARAADDLQFDPLLTPQLYMPLDHSILSQLLILLPILSMALLGVRYIVEERRLDEKRAKLMAVSSGKGVGAEKVAL